MVYSLLVLAVNASSAEGFSGLETALFLITSSGFTAIVVSIITAVVNKRKLKADEVNIISQAAGSVVDRLEKENVRLHNELNAERDKVADTDLVRNKLEAEVDSQRSRLQMRDKYIAYLEDTLTKHDIKYEQS